MVGYWVRREIEVVQGYNMLDHYFNIYIYILVVIYFFFVASAYVSNLLYSRENIPIYVAQAARGPAVAWYESQSHACSE